MRGMALGLAQDIRTIPNIISLSRLVLIGVATLLYFNGFPGTALTIGIIAALTDYVDGAVARATGQVTRLGEILDQFSDLCYESIALTIFVHQGFLPIYVIPIYAVREFWTLSVRRYMAGQRKNIPSSFLGKLKTNMLMWGLLPSFFSMSGGLPQLEPALGWIGKGAITAGLVLSWLSGWGYTKAFIAGYESESPGKAPASPGPSTKG